MEENKIVESKKSNKNNKSEAKRVILIVVLSLVALFIKQTVISCGIVWFFSLGFNDEYEITTDISEYNEVIGGGNKWGMSEEIFPADAENLNVADFRYVYYNPWDANYLAYLVVDYDDEAYTKEINRLKEYGITRYIGYYGATGFTEYELVAMNADSYYGFVYAITDGKSRIVYVEFIFCNNYSDIKYDEQIPSEYLPDGFDATIDNEYMKSH